MSFTPFNGHIPAIHPTAFIAPSADIIGQVEVGENASIWYGVVVRGDINRIVIGTGSNVQDNAVVHLADDFPAIIGDYVTVGHGAIVHACTIGDECLIGMGAIVLDGAIIGARSIIGAGAVVTPGTIIPPGSMVLGTPGKVVKEITAEKQAGLRHWAEKYVRVSRSYLTGAPYVPESSQPNP